MALALPEISKWWCFLTMVAVQASRAAAGDGALDPIRVCDVVRDPAAFDGKVVAIVGRYSFRRSGRFLGEDACGSRQTGDDRKPASLEVVFEPKSAPRTPQHLEIEAGPVNRLLKLIQQNTALAKFRFGTPEYDRWAVVYGRIEANRSFSASAAAQGAAALQRPAGIICAGDTVVMFLVDRY